MVLLRMAFEVLTFRSLFRNMKLDYREGPKIRYSSEKFLWLFAMMFHWAFLVVLIRHARLFTEPIAQWLQTLEHLDGFLEFNLASWGIGLPTIQISGLVLLGGVSLLLVRRIVIPGVRYISLAARLVPPVVDHLHRPDRHPVALHRQGGRGQDQGTGHGPGHLPSSGSRRDQRVVLHPLLPGVRACSPTSPSAS